MSQRSLFEPYKDIVRDMYAHAFVITGAEQLAREACALVIAQYPEGLSRKAALRSVRQEAIKLCRNNETSYEFLDNSPTLSCEISSVRRAAVLLIGAGLPRSKAAKLMVCSAKKLNGLYERAIRLAGMDNLKKECRQEMRDIGSSLSLPSLKGEVLRQSALADAKESSDGKRGRMVSLLIFLMFLLIIGALVWLAASLLAYYRSLRLENAQSAALMEDLYARIFRKG